MHVLKLFLILYFLCYFIVEFQAILVPALLLELHRIGIQFHLAGLIGAVLVRSQAPDKRKHTSHQHMH